jgi:hypothetical protein
MRCWIRTILGFCIFFVALGVTARLLNDVKLFDEVPSLRDKWAHYEKHKDEYDTLFIGTSRTYRGIMPALFDRLTGEAGVPTHSFNFGIDGMFPPEDGYVAERILSNPPKNLRWVFLEIGTFVDDFQGRDPDNVRIVHWHDLSRTVLVSRAVLWPRGKSVKWQNWLRPNDQRPPVATVLATHWRLFFVKTLNLGRGSEFAIDYALKRQGKGEAVGPGGDGFSPMPEKAVLRGEELEKYKEDLARRLETPARIIPMNRYGEEALAGLVHQVQRLGAKPVAFLAPTTGARREHPASEVGVPMFDFCLPKDFPDLFDPEVRSDSAHVNPKGAEAFTRRFVAKFIELSRSKGPSQAATSSPSR